jgi:hypothetical protein
MEDGVEYGIEKKGEGAYHYHNFKGHYEKDKNTPLRNDTLDPFSEARFIHRKFAPFCYEGSNGSPLNGRPGFADIACNATAHRLRGTSCPLWSRMLCILGFSEHHVHSTGFPGSDSI